MSGGLFQIAEPGESRVKEACALPVVGIDLGTTNSLIATVAAGEPRCLDVDEQGREAAAVGGGVLRGQSRGGGQGGRRRRRQPPARHHRLGEAIHGPRPG